MKYSPTRTCIVCRQKANKQDLLRIVEQNNNFDLDTTQKINTRGFYICKNLECINSIAKKRVLSRLKKTNVAESEHVKLLESLNKYLNKE